MGNLKGQGRLLFDVSSLARWTGPPVGMVRVQREILHYLPAGAVPVFFDAAEDGLRRLAAPWDRLVLGGNASIDLGDNIRRSGWNALIPSRYAIFLTLERRRLIAAPAIAAGAGWLQKILLALRRHDLVIHDAAGNRLARVPSRLALGDIIVPGPEDVLLMAGNGWYHAPAARVAALKRRTGVQLAAICYDIIPLQRPELFLEPDALACKTYWDAMFPLVDRLIVNSRAVANDIAEYCARHGLQPPTPRCVALGAALPDTQAADATTLPAGLQPERYALFVSTIEPRKGHAMLLKAWAQVQAMPPAKNFLLVFVGRIGWNVGTVLAELRRSVNVLHLPRADDALLNALYCHAGFCLYPSEYEGFGLPVIEAFAHGKAVITSIGGALPEAAAGLAPCLDPHDPAAWAAAIGAWIAEPALRRAAEARIRDNFVLHSWSQAASALIEAAISPDLAAIPASSAGAGEA